MENRLAEWRIKKGLSYRKLSELVGCDHKTIERLEKGERRLTVEWLSRLGKALNLDPKELLPSDNPAHGGASFQGSAEATEESRTKQLLVDLVNQMTEEEARQALQILNLAKEFGAPREGIESGQDKYISKLAG